MSDLGSNLRNVPLSDDAPYDPDRHDNQIVAVFEHRGGADRAREALLEAGIADSAIEVLEADPGASPAGDHRSEGGIWNAIKNLFAPQQEYEDFGQALHRGHAMVVATPIGDADRLQAIEVLERCEPLDFDAKRAEWREGGQAFSPNHRTMNRAAVTRADLRGKEPSGQDAVMLDMTGQEMRVKSMSAQDMASTTGFSEHDPELHPQSETTTYTQDTASRPLHEANSLQDRTVHGPRNLALDQALPTFEELREAQPPSPRQTSYTYGVPPEVASELSPEQQVAQQLPARTEHDRAESVKVVEERLRIGRREQAPTATRVRSYIAERNPASEQVRLQEEQIGDRSRSVEGPPA